MKHCYKCGYKGKVYYFVIFVNKTILKIRNFTLIVFRRKFAGDIILVTIISISNKKNNNEIVESNSENGLHKYLK